jgi:two-component system cell cycle sensor histidine kinase/response regulator CckA
LDQTSKRGCDMMQELLIFGRRTEARLLPVDINAQVKEMVQMLQSYLPATVSLSFELEEDLPPAVMVDASQFGRMLTNLIVNARDALPHGGKIVVSTDLIQFDHIQANSWQITDDLFLRVKISDNGVGMDEMTQSRIFEPFFTTKPEGKGTGLGLSVVFGFMEAHEGFIGLHSKMGEGTTFSLFFPLPSGTNVAPERIEVISPIRLLGKTTQPNAISGLRLRRRQSFWERSEVSKQSPEIP